MAQRRHPATYAGLPAYAVILRAIHSRGDDQAGALTELARRGLWLSPGQKTAAGLPADYQFTVKGS